MKEWSNWSGSLKFSPQEYLEPADEDALREIIATHYKSGKKIRLAAAGHSSSPLVHTSQTLLHLGKLKGLIGHDKTTATLQAGMSVQECNSALQKKGFALFNTGDVDVQTLAGAISTGTHGSGKRLQNLASILQGVRLINYKGDVLEFNQERNPEIMRAMRVSLGALGIFSRITVKILPLFELRRVEICTEADICVENFSRIAEENRNADFYWYPRSDEIKIRILNPPGKGNLTFDFPHKKVDDEQGLVGEILPRKRVLRFDEMEYALPHEAGLECFSEIRKRVRDKHRKEVAWRVLYRLIAKDENYLSPHNARDSVAISLHHNAGLPFENYFNDIEPIFRHFGGRPHWAKKHNMKAEELHALYPEWNAFQKVRKELDPEGYFLNEHLSDLFILK